MILIELSQYQDCLSVVLVDGFRFRIEDEEYEDKVRRLYEKVLKNARMQISNGRRELKQGEVILLKGNVRDRELWWERD